ncbi:MAG: hypothetical protein LKJ29_04900 [Lactobacillus sp.]|jgi:hypothetical protein|uniref:Uncharacterized protein n=1 Tax=Lacticaseibacillus suilingensis TaxID=2799577 RepID=A0ABW4BGY7_9LACO|nr:hypothetical protein [Lacticaseibacillus suilingensis]MCI1893735.1 hypothetical protein [Lactobacillus sp.]MCI1916715.1 hypothetical protein [Lactobacillus sp.]MCI1941370.1 hypothetical protein [Lactobacillus sp.]MCI1971915.1 hypothetical protein [Lactobacillus sp.]MCI2016578.1 hypothetical protein [Lactobacillus sp.]
MKKVKAAGAKAGNLLLDGAIGEIVGPILVIGLLIAAPVSALKKRFGAKRER